MTNANELLLAFAGFLVVLFFISVSALFRTRTIADFMIGGRSLNWFTTALSTHASGMSGWLLLGLPGMLYVTGFSAFWIVPGLLLGAFAAWIFIARRLRIASSAYREDAITLPQFFAVRTGSQSLILRMVPSLVVLIFYAIYLASGFIAGAKLIEVVFGWSYLDSLITGIAIIMVYVALGGFLAASWTDTFQGLLMIVALIVIATFAGMHEQSGEIPLAEFYSNSLIAALSLFAWGLGYLGQPHILARFMAIKDPALLGLARSLGLSWMLICCVCAVLVGIWGANIIPNLEDPEKIYIYLAQLLLNPWVAGFVIAAILAAITSTVDSQLIVASAAVTQDLGIGITKGVLTNRIMVILLCVFAGSIAYDPESIVDVVATAWAGLGSSFGPALLFCLYWRRTSPAGLIAGMLTGTCVTFGWDYVVTGVWAEIYEILPAFIFASIAVLIVSLLFPSEVAENRALLKSDFLT